MYRNEAGYLQLIREIIESDVPFTDNRTGIRTKSVVDRTLRFDLTAGFPLLTTKFVSIKNVWLELLWMMQGRTDAKWLSERGVKIWNKNGTRAFLDGRGLKYREGDLGPVYGFQWRHSGAVYRSCDADYTHEGVDQLANALELIKKDPNSRRIIVDSWNPSDLSKMALPPCHYTYQFFARQQTSLPDSNDDMAGADTLSCKVTMRSADLGLGVPYNIASYALLTHIMARCTGRKPTELILSLGDAHVYENHVDDLHTQLERPILTPPRLLLRSHAATRPWDFCEDAVALENYEHGPPIRMKMAV